MEIGEKTIFKPFPDIPEDELSKNSDSISVIDTRIYAHISSQLQQLLQ